MSDVFEGDVIPREQPLTLINTSRETISGELKHYLVSLRFREPDGDTRSDLELNVNRLHRQAINRLLRDPNAPRTPKDKPIYLLERQPIQGGHLSEPETQMLVLSILPVLDSQDVNHSTIDVLSLSPNEVTLVVGNTKGLAEQTFNRDDGTIIAVGQRVDIGSQEMKSVN
ncbi:MAG: hypothetical protein M3Q44_08215 [bacterium]|nr:hypothetical protein [bacterium]